MGNFHGWRRERCEQFDTCGNVTQTTYYTESVERVWACDDCAVALKLYDEPLDPERAETVEADDDCRVCHGVGGSHPMVCRACDGTGSHSKPWKRHYWLREGDR